MSRRLISQSLRCSPRPTLRYGTAFRFSFPLRTPATSVYFHATSSRKATDINAEIISAITDREKQITGKDGPVTDGPTARAQKHVGQPLSQAIISDIIQSERTLTGHSGPISEGPAAMLQKIFDESGSPVGGAQQQQQHSGRLDSETISVITEAEKKITGSDEPAKSGPTAQAQKHANEPIDSENLHDITEGEKKVTGEQRAIKGGPTAVAQSALGKSRNA